MSTSRDPLSALKRFISAAGPEDERTERVQPPVGVPATIGKYRVLREVGRGGMGVVYEGLDPDLGRRVAVKRLATSPGGGGQPSPERIEREARLAASLSHPGIVAIHEVGRWRDPSGAEQHYIVMDFVEGRTLAEAAPGLDLGARVRVVEEVARAIGHAHGRGVVHRDLKPENVLVRSDGRAVVTDFGLARSIEDPVQLTRSGVALGTLHYMAPEQALGRPDQLGPPTDVWALGVILYQLLCGARPFEGDSPAMVFEAILHRDPVRPRNLAPGTPRDLEAICLAALAKPPARRYADGNGLADDLARWREGRPILARPPGLVERLARRAARNPWAWGGTAAGAVCLAAALVLALVLARREREFGMSEEAIQALAQAQRALAAWEKERYGTPHDVTPARRELRRAAGLLEQALLAAPRAHPVWAELGWARLELGLEDGGREALERAVELAPASALYGFRLARAWMSRAERERREALAARSGSERSGWGRLADESRRLAARHFESALSARGAPGLEPWMRGYARAGLAASRGESARARELAGELAGREAVGTEEGLYLLGHLQEGLVDKARAYEQAAERARSWARAHVAAAYARAFLALGRSPEGRPPDDAGFRRAVESASVAVKIDPESLEPWIARGTARLTWGEARQAAGLDAAEQYREAAGDFRRTEGRSAQACRGLGRSALFLGRRAVRAGQAREASPWLEISDKCLSHALEAAGRHPSAARARADRGRARLEAGRPREALADFKQAIELDPALAAELAPLVRRAGG